MVFVSFHFQEESYFILVSCSPDLKRDSLFPFNDLLIAYFYWEDRIDENSQLK